MSSKQNPYIGTGLDEFLKEEGSFEELQAQAISEVVAWQSGEVAAHQPDVGQLPARPCK